MYLNLYISKKERNVLCSLKQKEEQSSDVVFNEVYNCFDWFSEKDQSHQSRTLGGGKCVSGSVYECVCV